MSTKPPKGRALQPQRGRGRERVDALIAAATAVFVERGFDAATMTEIAARAGANIGSLYRFFPSKEVLAQSVLAHELARADIMFDRIEDTAATISVGDLTDRLLNIIADVQRQSGALGALMAANVDREKHITRTQQWAIDRIERILRARPVGPHANVPFGDLAVVLLNGMKLVSAMTVEGTAPTSTLALSEIRLMFARHLQFRLDGPNGL